MQKPRNQTYTFEVRPGTRYIKLGPRCRATCHTCQKEMPIELRNMGNGDVREQPNCQECRKREPEE